jgi:hypothetical protein
MGQKYTSQTVTGYDTSPPPDDGSLTLANLITWAGIKGELGDPLNTAFAAINSALLLALDVSSRVVSGADTATSADNLKTIECSGTFTVNVPPASTEGAGYTVTYKNVGTGVITVQPFLGTDTLDGVADGTLALNGGDCVTVKVNSAATGYIVFYQEKGGVLTYNPQSANYTTTIADQGAFIVHPGSDATARTFIIDSNADVPYPIGTCVTIRNQHGAGTITVTINGTDFFVKVGTGAGGTSITLTADGLLTLIKEGTNYWCWAGINAS